MPFDFQLHTIVSGVKNAWTKQFRTTLSIAVVGATTLVACGEGDSTTGACAIGGGAIVRGLTVTGDRGAALTVAGDFPLPAAKEAQLAVLEEGTGEPLVAGTTEYSVVVTGVDGNTGTTIFNETVESVVGDAAIAPMLKQLAGCATDTGRMVMAMPVGQLWQDPAAVGLTTMAPEDTFIVTLDFDGIVEPPLGDDELLPQAEGTPATLPDGMPEVSVADNGEPTITMPQAAPPAELTIANLIDGSGETIAPGDTVYVHYTGVLWTTGKIFDSSWGAGRPISFETTGVIPGFQKALEGQKVGSRVVTVIPPSEGYGSEWLISNGGSADDAMVFVIDILGVQHA